MLRIAAAVATTAIFVLVTAAPARAAREGDDDLEAPAGARLVPPPIAVAPAAAPPPAEIWLGALQLVGGYAGELGGGLALIALGISPRTLGGSETASLGLAAAILPVFAGGAVCSLAQLSRHHRGGCATAFVGAYAGSALGVLLGMALAGDPGPDDTKAFMEAMAGLVGVVILAPVGGLIGYQVGKSPNPRDAGAVAAAAVSSPPPEVTDDRRLLTTFASEPRRGAPTEPQAPRLLLPVVHLRW